MDSSSNSTDIGVGAALSRRWANPSDILSLLLIVGGDIVQKAIAQLHGLSSPPFLHGRRLSFTPVAFSFGWVAFAFLSLTSAIGEKRLMPAPDCPSIVVNCASRGYSAESYEITKPSMNLIQVKYPSESISLSFGTIYLIQNSISYGGLEFLPSQSRSLV